MLMLMFVILMCILVILLFAIPNIIARLIILVLMFVVGEQMYILMQIAEKLSH